MKFLRPLLARGLNLLPLIRPPGNVLVNRPMKCLNRPVVRFYCEKVERPKEMDKRVMKEPGKKIGPISWFNLAVSGVLMGSGLAFYYYARFEVLEMI